MKLCCVQRYHIIACATRGKSQGETFHLLKEVYGEDSLSLSTCRRWYLRAKAGDKSSEDKECPGCKPTARNLANVRAVQEVMQVDRRAMVRQISAQVEETTGMPISTGSVHNILCLDLEMKKKAPKFVPRILTQEQKDLRVAVCHENLRETQDPLFLWSVITGDESWFSVLEPELKQTSCQWMHAKEKCPKKALWSCQARKTMMEVFFDDQGVVHLEFFPPWMTVTAKVYIGVLGQLREVIRRKRPELWRGNWYCLMHDNAPGHTATPTFTAMVETVSHPPYSPDLAPADFWFFPFLKGQIRGRIFPSVPALQDALMEEISNIPRATQGEYFEGDKMTLPSDSDLLESSSDSD